MNWRLSFPDAYIRHLPRLQSNHCPLLLTLHTTQSPCPSLRPFRFRSMWFLHHEFNSSTAEFWQQSTMPLDQKMDELRGHLQQWNYNVCGNIFRRKWQILRRLVGINRVLSSSRNTYLCTFENELMREYNVLNEQEEICWKQKSRKDWLKFGDQNTRFFSFINHWVKTKEQTWRAA